MEIIIAKNNGFCRGVQNAVDVALTVNSKGTYILGELIHNAEVIKQIESRGIRTVETLDEVPDGATVIFRSHGVPLSFYSECENRNIKYIDCTCKFVHNTQRIVESEYKKGRQIIICGEPTHPEVVGLQGWCNDSAIVVCDEGCDLSKIKDKNVSVVAQTTISTAKFEKIIKNIRKVCEKSVAVFKTICYTTVGRQTEARKLSSECDAIIVIGGANSSNTNKLYEVCSERCNNVIRLYSADDFDFEKIKNYKKIGIVSGASTPKAQTREVLLKMEEKSTEVNATNSEVKMNSMEEAVAKFDNESKFKRGQIVTATISKATDEGLMILLPYSKGEIPLNKEELDCETYSPEAYTDKIGETIDLLVVDLKPSLKLSQKMIKQLAEEEAKLADIEAGKEFQVVCTGFNKGGLVGQLGTYSVFVPLKEIRPSFVQDVPKYVGKTLRLRLIEIKKDGRRKEIIASQRVILQEERDAKLAEREAKDAEFFDSISEGDIVEGKVERATNFGAFVSVGGFDCLAHISDLAWTGTKAVTDVLEIGQSYHFKILKIDRANKKVSLGYKQLQPQPWDLAADKYHVDEIIHGKVVRIVPFGAFVEVEKGIDGLVHVSQISYERIETPATCLAVGQEVDAKIIAFDPVAKKMNLSIKACLAEPERKPREEKPEGEGKRTRAPRRDEDELSSWSDGSSVGTSLGDLLASAEKNNK